MDAASAYAHTELQAKYNARNPNALKQLVASKTKVLPFPKDIMDSAFKESMALYSEISAKNPARKKSTTISQVSGVTRTCGSVSPKRVSTVSCSRKSCKQWRQANQDAIP